MQYKRVPKYRTDNWTNFKSEHQPIKLEKWVIINGNDKTFCEDKECFGLTNSSTRSRKFAKMNFKSEVKSEKMERKITCEDGNDNILNSNNTLHGF
jgi:hypothetical protein